MGRKTDNEMKQIQQGLEAFLQQELREMEAEEQQRRQEPQLYTIGEEEDAEKELDVIGSASSRKKAPVKKRVREDYYIEDWDRAAGAGQGRRQPQDEAGRQTTQGRRTASGSRSPQAQNTVPKRRSKEKYSKEPVKASKRSAGKNSRKAAPEPPKRAGKKRGSGLKKLLIAMVLLVALAGGGLYFLVGNVYARMNHESIDSVANMPMQEDGVVNILLIGNDSRQNGEDGRSDAMILLSISNRTKTIYMTSLLRDMYVDIPGHDGNRLNAAYSYGGAELLMETVEENLDIPVNRYMLVNFEAFANLVDAVGGVDLELTTGELEYVNGYLVEYNMLTGRPQGTDNMDTTKPGLVHLNGPQALAYCRNRYIGTDFGRTERQRKVLTAVIGKLPAALGANFEDLMDGLMSNLTTNLTRNECYRLSLMAGKLLTYDIVSDSVPQPGTYKDATIRKMQVLEVDFEANIKYLKEKIYGETGE
ncbi:MAG: LCP family protein [Eubacterium sp.]|nr:LCP family protein [Eubacterium sp.]MCM1214895.1 LCP family protein [Lachnospiraceae bacterium]MCM1303522.1 LCP family protein [Butyrivibrio sp.]MCM1342714.1 LCP family protein [Muribaculaceae bacterium]MCM1238971.1 LCP family protein [Lachnospiraceae bacterium]